jgi:hypothetical protein
VAGVDRLVGYYSGFLLILLLGVVQEQHLLRPGSLQHHTVHHLKHLTRKFLRARYSPVTFGLFVQPSDCFAFQVG